MIQVLEPPAAAQLQGIVNSMEEAWNRHDLKAYAALFEEDADFVNVVGMHWKGRGEIEAAHIRLHETIFRDTAIRALNFGVRMLTAEIALCHVTWEMKGAHSLENLPMQQVRRGVMSLILRPAPKSEHGWLIANLHNTEVVNISMSDLK